MPRYLPPDLVQRMRQVLPLDLPPELRRIIAALLEDSYAWGYVDGCDRGAVDGGGFTPAPLLNGEHQRVGTAGVRVNGPVMAAHMAAHPSARRSGHALDEGRDPAPVTPLRTPVGEIGQIGEAIERDLLGTQRLEAPTGE